MFERVVNPRGVEGRREGEQDDGHFESCVREGIQMEEDFGDVAHYFGRAAEHHGDREEPGHAELDALDEVAYGGEREEDEEEERDA